MIQDYKLAALVHSQLVADVVHNEILRLGWDIHIEVTSYETALQDAASLLEQGYEALLCHGGFREELFARFGPCIVFIERSDIDLIKSLAEARKISTTVALTAHVNETRDIEFMEQLLDMSIIPVRYTLKDDLAQKIQELFAQGVQVFVGGGGTGRIVSRLGGSVFLDLPQRANIRNALNRAIILAENTRMERAYRSNIQAIMHYSKEGMICINTEYEVVFHNDQALNILRVATPNRLAPFFRPLYLEEVLREQTPHIDKLVTINERQLLINAFPLQLSSTATGALCFIHDVRSLQRISRKISADLQARGLVANYTCRDIVGNAPAIVRLKKNIQRYAHTDIPVFIYGETGTGKELVAHSLHAASSRSQQPFVVVNCAALPDPLLESELFGYEEGAFTGAKRGGKQGLFELANGGTLFLDEIGDISHAVQLRLLRVLDAREVMHVGGDRFIPINVRVLCASNKQLLHLVRKGTFRMDLYFRLTGVCLEVPPLRNRLEDIALFAAPLLRRYGKDKKALGPEIQKRLKAYNWPGNVRELMAVLESYLVLLGDQATSLACFEEVFRHRDVLPLTPPPLPAATMPDAGVDHNLGRQTTDFRRRKVMEELALNLGDRRKTAAALGISYSSLRRILENMKED